MKKFTIFVALSLLALAGADPDPIPVPDPLPDPDPAADPDPDPDPDHLKNGAQAYNPRQSRYQPQQPYPPQQSQYAPQQPQYPQQQQQPQYPQPQQQPQYPQPQEQPQYPQQQQQPQPQYPQQQQQPQPQYPAQPPYSQQPYPQQPYPPQQNYPPQQPYYPPQQQYPYPSQQQQQQPNRRGRLLDTPSHLNSVQPPSQFFAPAPGTQQPSDNTLPGGGPEEKKYNKRYPLTPPVLKFKIGIVSDLDQGSKIDGGDKEDEFQSILREGYLYLTQDGENPMLSNVTIEWSDNSTRQIKSHFNYGGRGMELSTLNVFAGKLYSCDDSTGIVFEIPTQGNETEPVKPIPWVILSDGNGTEPKGFKCEWAAIKNEELWIGGNGFNTLDENNETTSKNQKFVKRISPSGQVTTVDWDKNYDKIATALEVSHPGYVTHEAVGWSDDLERWMFIPKRISNEPYSEAADETKGSNAILIADEEFTDIQIGHIGEVVPERGFSGMKFIPGTQDQMVLAMKSKKADKGDESFIMAFDLKGNMLMNETKFADQKYQGIEFL